MVKLCLGTAQFGMDYGITNPLGKVPEKEVKKILEFASQNKINFFDTAQTYGNSEKILGKYLYILNNPNIITKLSSDKKVYYTDKDVHLWEESFMNSLKNLNINCINTFLIHDPNSLKKKGSEFLKNWLQSLIQRKLVKRLGVSIYDTYDLEDLNFNHFRLIQLPLSLYDQRLLKNGTIEMLVKKRVAIHARSIFFQGLLLNKIQLWPNSISKGLLNHHKKYFNPNDKFEQLKTVLSFINSCNFLEAALIGVTTLNDLKEIFQANKKVKILDKSNFDKFSWNNNFDLDPRKWN